MNLSYESNLFLCISYLNFVMCNFYICIFTTSLGFKQWIPRPFSVHKLTYWIGSKQGLFLSSSPVPWRTLSFLVGICPSSAAELPEANECVDFKWIINKVSIYLTLKCFNEYEPRYLENFKVTYRTSVFLVLGYLTVEVVFSRSV